MRSGNNLLVAAAIIFSMSLALFPNHTMAALDDGLVGYYPLDGNVSDLSAFTNNGSAYGATQTSDRNNNPNSALEFDGINDYLMIPHISELNMNLEGFAISLFIKVHLSNFFP